MIQDRKIIEFNQGRAILEVDCYVKTGRLSIDAYLIDSDEDFGSITIDLPYLFIKDYKNCLYYKKPLIIDYINIKNIV